MSFPRYESYKDSGVEWLGEIPEHWKFQTIGTCFIERREKVSDKDFAPLSVTMHGVVAQIATAAKTDDGENRKLVRVGDIAINSRSDRMGSSGLSNFDGSVSLINTVLQPREFIYPRYSHWMLKNRMFQFEFYRWGRGIVADLWTTKYSEMKKITLSVPPLPEQNAIASFLDHETAKIDKLIAEQQRLIELLNEKRQAVISHAVTKGLNPQAPIRDSGVKSIGVLPENWRVKSIYLVLDAIGDIDHYMPNSVDVGVPYLMTGDLKEFASSVDFENAKQVSKEDYLKLSKRIKSSKDDIILARYATIGTSMYIDIDRDFLVSYSCVTIKPKVSEMLGLFLHYYFQSDAFIQAINHQTNTNTQSNVGLNDLRKVKVPLPTLPEQLKIIEHLKIEVSKLEKISEASQEVINLMKERRSSLISAAVTGKIDVRNYVPNQEAA